MPEQWDGARLHSQPLASHLHFGAKKIVSARTFCPAVPPPSRWENTKVTSTGEFDAWLAGLERSYWFALSFAFGFALRPAECAPFRDSSPIWTGRFTSPRFWMHLRRAFSRSFALGDNF